MRAWVASVAERRSKITIKIITTTVTTLTANTRYECCPAARRANGSAAATSAYAVRNPNTDNEPIQSYISEPCTPRNASAPVAANINPAETATAALGVPWRRLVFSKKPGSNPTCAMRSSTRAAAVVQASTQANMLTNAPTSMAVPSDEMPALLASRCSGLVESLSGDDSPRNPTTSL